MPLSVGENLKNKVVNKCSAGKVGSSEASSKQARGERYAWIPCTRRKAPRTSLFCRIKVRERERGGKCVFVQLATEPGSFANNQKPRALALSSKHANATHLPRARFLLFALTHTDKRE